MRLAAENVALSLDGREVLRDVSLDLRPGTITALIGPNGAGKSTLLACLAGLRLPSGGGVLLGGRPLEKIGAAERARLIALLPQGGEVHWNVDVRTLVGLGRLPWRQGADCDPATERAMARADVAHLAGRSVLSLSGGERARVLLARALAVGAPWLLADEPLAGLDPLHQLDALGALREEARRGVGVVLVLHDLTLAARSADHVVVLHEGRVAADAPPDAALTRDLLTDVYGVEARIETLGDGSPVIVPTTRAKARRG